MSWIRRSGTTKRTIESGLGRREVGIVEVVPDTSEARHELVEKRFCAAHFRRAVVLVSRQRWTR
ncbi:hypothetical protein CYLTODRAFT_422896 [Cylindrobasidium torrendii FP15055 ss-10]|uniref:Uncharacterized protein n=1 Tax=Cylindrobasidium torrendii FP15055 ss-10 TaxID=1314674 RepID=A0A0D7B935_9AGAR|nr:hypothetical protein CYLTODRAFT_422896 [Cylindrobasidium torrendii FP15055 ss-10]